uniref:Uncharacterized protein n=1 Tax=Meloidogyne incognita TaxID=6306 RepID=A0A914KMU9_MELIC
MKVSNIGVLTSIFRLIIIASLVWNSMFMCIFINWPNISTFTTSSICTVYNFLN